jgi:hypothetical protein
VSLTAEDVKSGAVHLAEGGSLDLQFLTLSPRFLDLRAAQEALERVSRLVEHTARVDVFTEGARRRLLDEVRAMGARDVLRLLGEDGPDAPGKSAPAPWIDTATP